MNEKPEYPSYNINVGVPTEIESLIKIKTYKYHPYGLEGFRKDLINHVDKWQSEGLSWNGYDNLTHAWRTPWDLHLRYYKLMNPIVETALAVVKNHSPKTDWFLQDCWVSEYVENSAANKHSHGDDDMGWSFCYYVKMPDSGPAFCLCDDVNNSISPINVAEGDLLIFRNPLQHQVLPAIDRRIIISGNILKHDVGHILAHAKYWDENVQNTDPIMSAKHKEVDIDDWSETVVDQKLGIKLNEGY